MVILITIVRTNSKFSKEARKRLVIAFVFIIIGAASEWTCEMIKTGYLYKFNNVIFVKFIEGALKLIKFVLMPLMPVMASKAMFEIEEKNPFSRIIWLILKFYIIIGDLLLMVGFIKFITTEPSKFYNNMMYNIYVVTFIISTIYLFSNAFNFNKHFQNRYHLELVEIMLLVTVGVSIQVANLEIKTCWLTISVASTFIYIYYNELVQCLNGMTGLLNHESFNNYIEAKENESKECIIIIMDVNDFKYINDNYGHAFGDKILIEISKILKNTYQKYGKCYRMGGDEFAVILQSELNEIETINRTFIENLETSRKKIKELPHISWGYSKYDPNEKEYHSLKDAKQEADDRMYEYKKALKKQKKNNLSRKAQK